GGTLSVVPTRHHNPPFEFFLESCRSKYSPLSVRAETSSRFTTDPAERRGRSFCETGYANVGRVLNPSAAEGGRFAPVDALRTRPTSGHPRRERLFDKH